jgi:hypothetical protein
MKYPEPTEEQRKCFHTLIRQEWGKGTISRLRWWCMKCNAELEMNLQSEFVVRGTAYKQMLDELGGE